MHSLLAVCLPTCSCIHLYEKLSTFYRKLQDGYRKRAKKKNLQVQREDQGESERQKYR